MNHAIIVKNRFGNYAEILTDIDYSTFKYTYEKNNERQIEFTAIRTSDNFDIFDMLVNESYIIYEGQHYVIKQTTLTHDNAMVTNAVVCKHIFMEAQNHYVNTDQSEDTLNADAEGGSDTDEETTSPEYTLEQYLDFGFKDNMVGMSYNIVGDIRHKRAPISELGNKNGMEYIVEGAELFGYVYFADNKVINFYSEEDFYKQSDVILYYKYNTQDVQASITTTDLKTFARGYGKKKTKTETRNYNPVKPSSMKLTGTYNKDGTWYTTGVGNTYYKTINCKWGNEVLTWNNKKQKYGGNVDIFLDGEKVGTFSQYSKNATTVPVVVSKHLEKGEHVFKAVFKGARSGVNYKGHAPRMYLNTAKGTVLNLTSVLQDKTLYHAYAEYKSPNSYEAFGHMEGATYYSKTATTSKDLIEELKETINDTPNIELSTSYIGYDEISENNTLHFYHKVLKFNEDLKVVKLTKFHPYTQTPSEIEFSNAAKDLVSIQRNLLRRIQNVNSSIAYGGLDTGNIYYEGYSDVVGSVIVDE